MNEQVWRGEIEITLRRKTFEVLRHLVERSGQLVTRTALLDAIWPNVVVNDSMPSISVGELRKALGDEAKSPQFIETVHGRGYRFIAKVTSAVLSPAIKPRPLAPRPVPIIVGREAELARLRNCFERAVEGRRQILFVAGEAGIGKTALILAFLDSVSKWNTAVRIACGQCVERYEAGEPYMPMMEALLSRVLPHDARRRSVPAHAHSFARISHAHNDDHMRCVKGLQQCCLHRTLVLRETRTSSWKDWVHMGPKRCFC